MIIFLKIALRNVRVNWRHSLAALISIGCAYFSLVVFQGYINNTQNLYYAAYQHRGMYGDVIIENKNIFSKESRLMPFNFYLTEKDQTFVDGFLSQHASDITAKARFLEVQGVVTNGLTSNIFVGEGHDLEQGNIIRGDVWSWNTIYGAPIEQSKQVDSVLLGRTLGRVVGCIPTKAENPSGPNGGYIPEVRPFKCLREDLQLMASTEKGQVNAFDLTAVGLLDGGYKEMDARLVSMSLSNAQLMLGTKKITYETVLLNNQNKVPAFIADFKKAMTGEFSHLEMVRWQDHRAGEMYAKTMSILYIFRNFVIIVIGIISALTVLSSTMKTVTERTREIGTLQSLGFKKSKVLMIFLLESVGLATLGCFIGFILALATTFWVNYMRFYYQPANLSQPIPLHIDVSAFIYILAIVCLMVLNMLTVWAACRRVLKKSIVDCMNHV
jgi:putative ABC transport system permease protein